MISIQIQILRSELPRVRPNFSHRSSLLVIRDIIVFLTFDDDFSSNSDSAISITSGRINFQPSSTTINNFENERLFDL